MDLKCQIIYNIIIQIYLSIHCLGVLLNFIFGYYHVLSIRLILRLVIKHVIGEVAFFPLPLQFPLSQITDLLIDILIVLLA